MTKTNSPASLLIETFKSVLLRISLHSELIERIMLLVALVLLLFPIWSNAYFLTGDGPCHLYNARILLDYFKGEDLDFYTQYYLLNTNTEPNWFSHISLAFLLQFFSPALSEKILLTIYVLLFAFLLRGIFKQINASNTFLIFLGLPFAFHHTVQMGFYNYSFGFVFCFLSICYWLKIRESTTWLNLSVFVLINLLTYFTHPIGFLLSGLIIGSIEVSSTVLELKNNSNVQLIFKRIGYLTFGFLPSVILMLEYLSRKGLNPTPNPDSFDKLFRSIKELTSLVNLSNIEGNLALLVSAIFAFLLVAGLIVKIRSRTFTKFDGIFFAFLLMLFAYFNQPGALAGAGILSKRLQFIPHLVLLLWFGSISYHHWIRKVIGFSSFAILVSFMLIRIPIHQKASLTVEEYISVGNMIPASSTVLPLSFSHNGLNPDGSQVSNRIWMFIHAFDYLGAEKPLILFGNYEANTGYFPIIWKENKNPYLHLSQGNGLEALPPGVGLERYEKETESSIDYVVLWCFDQKFSDDSNTIFLHEELAKNYRLIHSTEHGLAELYQRQPIPDTY